MVSRLQFLGLYYYVSNIVAFFICFLKTDGQFVSFLVTKVLCEAWQYLQMDAFSFHVELIARKDQPSHLFTCYIKLPCLAIND